MDYWVYQIGNDGKLQQLPCGIPCKSQTQEGALAIAQKMRDDWAQSGAPRFPGYAIVYNGTGERVGEVLGKK